MGSVFRRCTLVLQDDELRGLRGALGYGKQRPHAQLFHGGTIQDLGLETELTGHCLGSVCKVGGRTDIRGQIGKILGQIKAVSQRLGV